MFLSTQCLRRQLKEVLLDLTHQGHQTAGLMEQLLSLPESIDAMLSFARTLAVLPLREEWQFVEPLDWEGTLAAMAPSRSQGPLATISTAEAAGRIETAFLSSVCGCILGKPLEVSPTLKQLQEAFTKVGQWPISDYVSTTVLNALGRRHGDWTDTVREKISYAASDDDLNYSTLGMLLLEQSGGQFTHQDLRDMWLMNLPPMWCWGPERTVLIRAALQSQGWTQDDPSDWAALFNPGNELCGAMIRADAYGYACPGNPQRAAELAFKDASFTHRRTGVYGTMFAAAAIAAATVVRDPLEVFQTALQYVPQRSRFFTIVSDALDCVAGATDFSDGYERIHSKYHQYGHCRVYQESGTLINTLRFATDIGDGICKQVMQGNDTDSYGCTAGSILGNFFGPGHLDQRWLAPFNDTIHLALATFHGQSLSSLAKRMSQLPQRIASA